MAGSTLKEETGVLNGWLHIEGRDRFTGCLATHRRKRNIYWMAGSTLKEGAGLLDGWVHIKGIDRFTEWLAIH